MTENKMERGAAEDAYGVPVTPTDVEASRTPPSQGPSEAEATPDDAGAENVSSGDRGTD
jgi:hypothetical protein